jgi:hypothetical protein
MASLLGLSNSITYILQMQVNILQMQVKTPSHVMCLGGPGDYFTAP